MVMPKIAKKRIWKLYVHVVIRKHLIFEEEIVNQQEYVTRPLVGKGRRSGLKIRRQQWHPGSIPGEGI